MTERWIIDAGGPAPLVLPTLTRNGGCRVVDHRTPPPAPAVTWAKRPEGSTATSRDYENREVTIKLALERPLDAWWSVTHDFGQPPAEAEGDGLLPGWTGTVRRATSDGSPIRPMVGDLSAVVGKLQREGGTLTRVMDDGGRVTFDVATVTDPAGPLWDDRFYVVDETTVELTFTCAPFGRGAERLLGQGTKAAGSRFVLVDGLQVPGDVPALARIEFSGATVAQQSLLYAIDRQGFPTQIDGGTRLLSASGTVVAPPAGAVGASTARLGRAVPAGQWAPIAFVRGTDGTLPAAVGTVRVLARVMATAAVPQVRLRWSPGAADGGTATNAAWTAGQAAGAGTWCLADLGLITVPSTPGVVDGVIEVSATGGACHLDVVLLVPTERSARAMASPDPALGGTQVAVDPLTGTGALTGSAASVGGAWVGWGSGTGTDFARSASGATRAVAVGDCRVDTLPVAAATLDLSARVVAAGLGAVGYIAYGIAIGNAAGLQALLTRTGTTGAWAVAFEASAGDFGQPLIAVRSVIGTTFATRASTTTWATSMLLASAQLSYNAATTEARATLGFFALSGFVAAPPAGTGQLYAGAFSRGATSSAAVTFADVLATSTVANDRVLHPALAAQITTTTATRQTPSGLSGPIAVYRGDRPFLPPSGREGAPTRVLMGASRDDLRTGVDSTAGDTFTGRVFATPRYLQLPDQNA